MLVLSRKENERIVFPQLGITVSILNLTKSQARVGIDAPKEVAILRGELEPDEASQLANAADSESHESRNLMNTINLHVMLYQQQFKVGLDELATKTLMKLVDFLDVQARKGIVDFEFDNQVDELNGHVMLVEDDPNQCELLGNLLSMRGLDVSAYHNGDQALVDLRKGKRPSVILMDWEMGQFGGAWLSTRVAEEFGEKRPKLFVLSGTKHVPQSQLTFVDSWLSKPLNHDLLVARLKAIGMVAA